MTIGERIAILRKGKNLSQEALGEILGVTRQSISKWEGDGALPEMEKLIAMCKYFGVTINYLLGLEIEGESDVSDSKTKPNTTLDTMLKQYTEENLKQTKIIVKNNKKNYKGLVIGTLAISLAIVIGLSIPLVSLFNKTKGLEKSISDMEYRIVALNNDLNGSMSMISHEIRNILNEQNEVINDISHGFSNFDFEKNTAECNIEITPKKYSKDMTVEVEINNGNDVVRTTLLNELGEKFVGSIPFVMTDDVTTSAIITENGVSTTVQVEKNYPLKMETMLNVKWDIGSRNDFSVSNENKFDKYIVTASGYREVIAISSSSGDLERWGLEDVVKFESIEGEIIHNGKVNKNLEFRLADNTSSGGDCVYELYNAEYEIEAKLDDVIVERYTVTDNFGRKSVWETRITVVPRGGGSEQFGGQYALNVEYVELFENS